MIEALAIVRSKTIITCCAADKGAPGASILQRLGSCCDAKMRRPELPGLTQPSSAAVPPLRMLAPTLQKRLHPSRPTQDHALAKAHGPGTHEREISITCWMLEAELALCVVIMDLR